MRNVLYCNSPAPWGLSYTTHFVLKAFCYIDRSMLYSREMNSTSALFVRNSQWQVSVHNQKKINHPKSSAVQMAFWRPQQPYGWFPNSFVWVLILDKAASWILSVHAEAKAATAQGQWILLFCGIHQNRGKIDWCSLWPQRCLHKASVACFIDLMELLVLHNTKHTKVPFASALTDGATIC